MKALLTGAGGFVGSFMSRAIPCVPLLSVNGTAVDLRKGADVREVIHNARPDVVIHLAAQSYVLRSFENPMETFETNFLGTFNLLQGLEQEGFTGTFLFVGSGDTYGVVSSEQLPIIEECALRPRNPYAVSKVAAEALCFQWSVKSQFKVVMARSFNHIGPGQKADFVVPAFARQITEIKKGIREPVVRVGNIEVTRDFTDVRDVVRAYTLLIESGENGEVYNVCSGREVRIADILEMLIKIAGIQVKVETDPERTRSAEQTRHYGNNAKLHTTTGWQPTIDIHESLRDILDYWEREIR